MTKIRQVRNEFKEPFRDVVKGFAIMGYSRKATAQALQISHSYFDELCERFDLKKNFRARKDYLPICKPPGHPKGKIIKQPKHYTDSDLLSILRGYLPNISGKRFDELQQGKPCSDTYLRRFGSWKKAKILARRLRDSH